MNEVDQNTSNNTTAERASFSQYAEARKALQSIGNSKSHKNQTLSSTSKFCGNSQQEVLMFNKAAEEGNFAKLISLLASQKTDEDRHCLMNEARCRQSDSEQGGKISTKKPVVAHSFASPSSKKGKEWYDLTPLAVAAMNGRANVVEYLLRQGADPTLRGSPTDDEDYNALEAAKQGVKGSQKDIDLVLSSGKDGIFDSSNSDLKDLFLCEGAGGGEDEIPVSALLIAQTLVQNRDQCLLCLSLLEAVEKFWPTSRSYSSIYRKRNYNNKPKDMKALRAAVDAITLEATDAAKTITPANEALVNRLAAKIASPASSPSSSSQAAGGEGNDALDSSTTTTKPRKLKKNRRHRYSDTFCIPPPREMEMFKTAGF